MKVAKIIILTLLNVISVALIVVAAVALIIVATTQRGEAPNFFGYSLFRVMSGSMEPEIETGSMIIVKRVDAGEIKVGDVISFYSQDPTLGGAANTHRVIEIDDSGMDLYFVTKGDANQFKDQYGCYEADLIGVVLFSSPLLGQIVRIASNPVVFFPFIIIPLGAILIINVVDSVKAAKKLAKEEEDAAVEEIKRKLEEERQSKEKKSENPENND